MSIIRMPVVLVDRLPLPSLRAYSAVSVLLLSCSLYYAFQITNLPEWKVNRTQEATDQDGMNPNPRNNDTEPAVRLMDAAYFMIQEPLCIWTLINMAYCCLILIGKFIQKLVFGELRVSEQQHVKDKFWNFVFYKFIFIFGVMNVQFIDEVVLWCSWFSVLGFFHLLAQLCKDRFEYLSFSPTTPKWTHIRLLTLLMTILVMSSSLFVVCIFVGLHTSINTFAFMAAECVLLILRTLYVIVRYAIHLWDISHDGVWENRGTYIYFTELIFELTALTMDSVHHLHMLIWGNIFLSMASLVICMQLRYLFYEIQRRMKKHKNYLRVVRHMEKNYPMALAEELDKNSDDCAICWDKMETARKLPCGHLFHNSCLRSWLEQDTSCPTCRTSLSDNSEQETNINQVNNDEDLLGGLGTNPPDSLPDSRQNRTTTNHFFHFDGSRYVSWFPSFSVEVTHTPLLARQHVIQTSQLDNMARQVQQMFPSMPLALILDDLRSTRSVELTIENILEERLVPPPFPLQNSRLPSVAFHELSRSSSEETTSSHVEVEFDTKPLSEDDEISTFLDELTESDNEGLLTSLGGRFSKSSEERERMLARRKEEMLAAARKKYLAKMQVKGVAGKESSGENPQSFAENRRHLAYQAAQRRLAKQKDS